MMRVPRDEDYTVPQTGEGDRWLTGQRAITLDAGAMVVLADVMALLADGQDTLDDARDLALYVVEHVRSLYGLTSLHIAA